MGRGGDKNLAAGIFYGRAPLRSKRPEVEPGSDLAMAQLCLSLRVELGAAEVNKVNASFDSDERLSELGLWSRRGAPLLLSADPETSLGGHWDELRGRLGHFITRVLKETGEDQRVNADELVLVHIDLSKDLAAFERYDPEDDARPLLWVDLASGRVSEGEPS